MSEPTADPGRVLGRKPFRQLSLFRVGLFGKRAVIGHTTPMPPSKDEDGSSYGATHFLIASQADTESGRDPEVEIQESGTGPATVS